MSQSDKEQSHNFHLVDPSPWPILSCVALFMLSLGASLWLHKYNIGKILVPAGLIMMLSVVYLWWGDVIKEGIVDKAHTDIVRKGLKIGMVLFIISEVMFFAAFFWSYFEASLSPVEILEGVWPVKTGIWPPQGIATFDPWDLPLLNTLILLLSGTTITWAHYAMQEKNYKDVLRGLKYTILLGIIFTCLQVLEYHHAPFKFTDGIYASNFFMATGFHGAHVIIGNLFLITCFIRAKRGHFQGNEGHLGFEFAAWYWHFVDVVWLFLYVFVYLGV